MDSSCHMSMVNNCPPIGFTWRVSSLGGTLDHHLMLGGCHDQADAEWIANKRPLRGHNNTPFSQPILGRPIGCPGVGHPQDVFGVFSCCYLVVLYFLTWSSLLCQSLTTYCYYAAFWRWPSMHMSVDLCRWLWTLWSFKMVRKIRNSVKKKICGQYFINFVLFETDIDCIWQRYEDDHVSI
jgi:hypothetical protein